MTLGYGKGRSLRIILFALLLLSLLAIAGASCQAIASHADAQRFPRPGQLIRVGNFRLNVSEKRGLRCRYGAEGGGAETDLSPSCNAAARERWFKLVNRVIVRLDGLVRCHPV